MKKISITLLMIVALVFLNFSLVFAKDDGDNESQQCYYELNDLGEYELVCPITEGENEEYPIDPCEINCILDCWGKGFFS